MENGFQSDCFNSLLSSCYDGKIDVFFFSCSYRPQGTFTCIYAPSHTTYLHTHIYMHMHTCTSAHLHANLYVHTHAFIQLCVPMCTHLEIYICTYTSISNPIYHLSIYLFTDLFICDYVYERLLVFNQLKQGSQ